MVNGKLNEDFGKIKFNVRGQVLEPTNRTERYSLTTVNEIIK